MKTVFELGEKNPSADVLLVVLGQDHCCYAFLDQENRSISYLKYVGFDDHEGEERFAGVLDDVGQTASQVLVSSNYPQALLVPRNFSGSAGSLLEPVYDLPLQIQLKDMIGEWRMEALYSLPAKIYGQLTSKFPRARFFHSYTTTLKTHNGINADDQIEVHITTRQFSVLVKKDKQVQLAQTYSYKSPLDVVYFLLKICYEFQLDQSSAYVILSGLIEKDSAMYKELHGYFMNLHFAEAANYELPQNELPHHYFTSLYNLAACAS